jgi:para-nitrobenzyl esterase
MDNLTVSTSSGPVRGVEEDGVVHFFGIPYAAPPTGERRFRVAQPPTPWTETFLAETRGPRAPQRPSPMEVALSGGDPPPWDEESCLTLNVWTAGLDDRSRPVMVWIHGGAFIFGTGSSPWYDGQRFAADHDVVLISFNYRLGVLGFTYLGHLDPSFADSGSLGVRDAVTVLTWVHDNVAAFGGDPNNVTIFGESAGAMSVGTLLSVPEARPLFHKAILQSGSASVVFEPAEAETNTNELLTALAITSDPVAALQAVPIETLLKAHASTMVAHLDEGLRVAPVVDGVVVERRPLHAVRDGFVSDKVLLIGTNRDEWRLFAISNPSFMATTDEELATKAARYLGDDADAGIKQYRQRLVDDPPSSVLAAVVSDSAFRIPALRLADAQVAAGGSAYVYLFTFESPRAGGLLGSCHALELPFVFNNMGEPGVSQFVGDAPPTALATAMNEVWAQFARTGTPSGGPLGLWPRYESATRPTMVINEVSEVQSDPLGDERLVWMTN